ncbi:MAG: pilus assembly protein PilO [Gammaproteobacteria bacterium]|nr:MAG: pilus assembly protein PilO [Gammaproteobacteria bacterium]
MAFDLNQLNELDFDNVGAWPPAVKWAAHLIVFALVVGLGYFFDTSAQQETLAQAEQKEETLKREYETKYRKAANLEAYKQQMEEMRKAFQHLLQQLPKSTEIPGLIDDIAYSEAASGLEVSKGKLEEEKRAEFYIEKPFRLQVRGTYHNIGKFVSRVASLPRIVTLHDFTIELDDQFKKKVLPMGTDPKLKMDVQAKTYRYEQGEEE